jgi:hypothetical protein
MLIAFGVSTLSLVTLIALRNAYAPFQAFNLYVIPTCVAAGLVPLIYWYRRDAYPIGLAYCIVAFFALRPVARAVLRLF